MPLLFLSCIARWAITTKHICLDSITLFLHSNTHTQPDCLQILRDAHIHFINEAHLFDRKYTFTQIHTHLTFLPNGLWRTVTVTAATTSVPAVEQNSVRETRRRMLRSQLQDYLSLNKLHYCLYYPGILSLEKALCRSTVYPAPLCPMLFPRQQSKDGVKTRWERGKQGAFMWLAVVSSRRVCSAEIIVDWLVVC